MVKLGRTMQFLLHLDSPEINYSRAKTLRKTMTEAEAMLWLHLRNNKLKGYKFRRQHPIGHYIADFYCHEKRLIIEVDGPIHLKLNVAEYDENRSAELERSGITIIRVTNDDINEDLDNVLKRILLILDQLPSP